MKTSEITLTIAVMAYIDDRISRNELNLFKKHLGIKE